MDKITKYIKNMGISKEEKLMRKHGLKNEHGEYTVQAKEIVINDLCKQKEKDLLLSIAKGIEEEELKNNKE